MHEASALKKPIMEPSEEAYMPMKKIKKAANLIKKSGLSYFEKLNKKAFSFSNLHKKFRLFFMNDCKLNRFCKAFSLQSNN